MTTAGQDFIEALDARVAEIVDACTKCGKCVEACPMIEPAGIEAGDPSAVAGGVIDLLGGGPGTEAAERWANVCTGSGYCIPACEYGINPRFMVKMAKVAAERRNQPEPVLQKRATETFRTMTRGVRMLSRLQMEPEILARINPKPTGRAAPERPPEVVFYTGCNILKTPHIALLCLDVLDAIDAPYEVRGGTSTCCGVFQFNASDTDASGRMAYNTIEQLASAGTAEVLSWCPSCQVQVGEIVLPSYQLSTGETPFELTPYLVYLERRLDDLKPLMVHPVNKRVALNERPVLPGVVQAVRRLLEAIPGIEFVDLEVPRVGTMSNILSVLPDFKQELREKEFAAAAEAGVDTLATIFHACHREICHFETGLSFEIVNFMELLGESMGIASDDLYKRLKIMQDVDAVIADCKDMVDLHRLDLDQLRDSLLLDMLSAQPVGIRAAE